MTDDVYWAYEDAKEDARQAADVAQKLKTALSDLLDAHDRWREATESHDLRAADMALMHAAAKAREVLQG